MTEISEEAKEATEKIEEYVGDFYIWSRNDVQSIIQQAFDAHDKKPLELLEKMKSALLIARKGLYLSFDPRSIDQMKKIDATIEEFESFKKGKQP